VEKRVEPHVVGIERLEESSELEDPRRSHAEYYLEQARTIERLIRSPQAAGALTGLSETTAISVLRSAGSRRLLTRLCGSPSGASPRDFMVSATTPLTATTCPRQRGFIERACSWVSSLRTRCRWPIASLVSPQLALSTAACIRELAYGAASLPSSEIPEPLYTMRRGTGTRFFLNRSKADRTHHQTSLTVRQ
jgi:hypothetical protein